MCSVVSAYAFMHKRNNKSWVEIIANYPKTTIAPLQRAQNAAARLVARLGPRDQVSNALRDLHWLPVQHRITYKLCLLMHLVHNNRAPSYLVDSVTATASLSHRTTSDRKQPTLRAAENTTQIRRALFHLCWSSSMEQPSVISSRTNRYYSF